MADINKFQRSRDRINEILHRLVHEKAGDLQTAAYVNTLEISLQTLHIKMEEHQQGPGAKNDGSLHDLSF